MCKSCSASCLHMKFKLFLGLAFLSREVFCVLVDEKSIALELIPPSPQKCKCFLRASNCSQQSTSLVGFLEVDHWLEEYF